MSNVSVSKSWVEGAQGELDRLRAEVSELKAQVARLSAAGQVLSEHVDRAAGARADSEAAAHDQGAEAMRAACRAAVLLVAERNGLGPYHREQLAAAINEAVP